MSLLHQLAQTMAFTSAWLLGLGALFAVLTRYMPCNPGMRWWERKRDVGVDLLYWMALPPIMSVARQVALIGVVSLLFAQRGEDWLRHFYLYGYGWLGSLPLVAQAALILVVQDIYLYAVHRWFHTKALWRYHAVHHATKMLDWISTRRFHPVNLFLSFSVADIAALLMGFSPQAILLLTPFNIFYSALVHANLNWTFGPLRYVLASPVFHRWHHTAAQQGGMRNFAATFPVLDILFGTFYMPRGVLPKDYGISDPHFPEGFWGQMMYPFRKQ